MSDEPTEEEARALTALIGRGTVEAMRTEDFEALRALVTREAPAAIPRLTAESDNAQGCRAVVNAVTTSLWNTAPLPSNGYRPRPLPAPGRNDPCPCGSGQKFKRCCGTVSPGFPALPEESTWQVLVEHLTSDELVRFVNDPALPPQPLALLAAEMRERDLSDAARTALSRRLARPETLDDRFEAALSVLFDLESDAHPIGDFVAWANDLAERLPRRLKAVAYRHLVPAAVTAREIGVAKALLDRIRAVSPDDPSLAPLEVITLLAAGERVRASERARFWLAWLRRHGLDEEMPEAVELLEHTARDPEGAAREFREVELPFAKELAKLVSVASTRPARPYGLEVFEGDAVFARRPRGVPDAEKAWRRVWHRSRSFPGWLHVELPEFLTEEPEPWLSVLRKHPGAFDSLEVLDDLVQIAGPAADDLDPTWDDALLGPILERAAAIVRASVAKAGSGVRVPWAFLENRPALRLLSRLACRLDERGREEEAATVYEAILALNPNDNQGHRSWLVDHYLRRGSDARALALADRYPDDALAETRFGRGLALWRLGRRAEAEAALAAAAADRPRVVRALLAADLVPPEMEPDRVSIGGDDEAWIYRESMRETWLATPDALEYLRGLPALAPGHRKRRRRIR